MCKQIFCLCLCLLFLSFSVISICASADVCFSLDDVKVSQNCDFETTLSANSSVAAFVAHLEFDENALEFKDAKAVNSSAELSVNYQNDGKLSMAYLMKNGTKGELITLCFNLKDSNASINLRVEQVIDSMGNDVYVCSCEGADVALAEFTSAEKFSETTLPKNIGNTQQRHKSHTALTETFFGITEPATDCISLPAIENGSFPLIVAALCGVFIALGIGVIAFILGRGTNKTNEKDKYEKDT